MKKKNAAFLQLFLESITHFGELAIFILHLNQTCTWEWRVDVCVCEYVYVFKQNLSAGKITVENYKNFDFLPFGVRFLYPFFLIPALRM